MRTFETIKSQLMNEMIMLTSSEREREREREEADISVDLTLECIVSQLDQLR